MAEAFDWNKIIEENDPDSAAKSSAAGPTSEAATSPVAPVAPTPVEPSEPDSGIPPPPKFTVYEAEVAPAISDEPTGSNSAIDIAMMPAPPVDPASFGGETEVIPAISFEELSEPTPAKPATEPPTAAETPEEPSNSKIPSIFETKPTATSEESSEPVGTFEASDTEKSSTERKTAAKKEIPSVFETTPPAPKLSTEPLPHISPADEAMEIASHYQPAFVPESVHSIKVNDTKFEVSGEMDATSAYAGLNDVIDVEGLHVDDILRTAIERKASDVHFTVGLPPMARIDGELAPLQYTVLTPHDTRRLIYDTLTDDQIQTYEETHELDFSYGVKGVSRFRFNVYMQRSSVAAALRAIPTKIPTFEQLGLPAITRDLSKRASGLILVTGPTGSGKSTTIASMIDDINERRTSHIMTIEDPIEYLHQHKKCMVNQREMHADTFSFHNALRAVLREDPDIILVGELRDLETIEAALTLAETGHLVFGTLHTRNAPATVDRIIDVFPTDAQDQIRVQLGNTLEGVISQTLLPRLGGGRVGSFEVMIGVPAIKNLIREGKTHQMYSIIETNSQIGMQTMDRSLATIFREGMANYEECLMRSVDKENFARLAKGG